MGQMLQNSIAVMLLARLYAIWRYSLLARLSRGLKRSWRHSAIRIRVAGWLSLPLRGARASWLNAWLRALNRRLARSRIPAAIRGSVFCRIYGAVMACFRGSRVFGGLFAGGMTSLLLFAAAIYVPLDWILKDVMPVPVLSSVWDDLLLLWGLIWVLRTRMTEGRTLKPRTNPLDAGILLFLGIGLGLMFAVGGHFSIQVAGYRATVEYMLWFFVILRLLRNDRDLMLVYLTMVAVAFVVALHGLYQYAVAVPIPSSWTDQAEAAVRTRVFSIFGSPNIMGDFMVMFAPMAAALAYWFKDWKLKLGSWIVAFCMCGACLFTMSRGAWIALVIAILIFSLLVDRRLILVMVIVGLISLTLPFVASRLGYLFTDDFAHSTANGGRASRWLLAKTYLEQNPMFGFGLGMFGGAVAMQHQIYSWISYFYVDNYYMKILVEMGYLGLTTFLFLIAMLLITACRSVHMARKQQGNLHPLAAGMLAGLCGVLAHCCFENIFEEPYMMVCFWTIAAMIVYIGFFRRKKAARPTE